MKTAKPLSKTAQLKLDRANRQAKKLAAKKAEIDLLARLRETAAAATKSLPADFGSWGVVRTRAYMKLIEIVSYRASLKTVTSAQLQPFVQQLLAVPTMHIGECAALEQVNSRIALNAGA